MKQTKELISLTVAKEYLNLLVGKDVSISCGYGGVMFLEALDLVDQKIKGRKPKLYHGSYRLFCDEIWDFSFKGEKPIGRFDEGIVSFDFDLRLAKLGISRIDKIEIVGDFKRTSFYLENGCVFTIIRVDALDTFTLTLIPEAKKLTFWGDGTVELADYQDYPPSTWTGKAYKRLSKNVSISREFLRERCQEDYYPIAIDKAKTLMTELIGQPIHGIRIESGTKFLLEVGSDYRKYLATQAIRDSYDFLSTFRIDIEEIWSLARNGTEILSARQNAFHFGGELEKELVDKHISGIEFESKGEQLKIAIEGGYVLQLSDSKRYSRWSMSNSISGLFIGSYRDAGLVHRISTPIHLTEKYKTDDIHLSGMWQELDFYREYFSK